MQDLETKNIQYTNSSFLYLGIITVKIIGSIETLVPVYQITRCPTSKDCELDNHNNLKSHYSVFSTTHMLKENVIFPNRSVY
jgi:hypothetical protein